VPRGLTHDPVPVPGAVTSGLQPNARRSSLSISRVGSARISHALAAAIRPSVRGTHRVLLSSHAPQIACAHEMLDPRR
jgi:hypothetical protein